MYQQNKSFESKVKFRQAYNHFKRVLEAAKLVYDLWQIANSVLHQGKSTIPPLFIGPEVLSSASDKAKLIAKNFSKNSNLDDLGIFLPVFHF